MRPLLLVLACAGCGDAASSTDDAAAPPDLAVDAALADAPIADAAIADLAIALDAPPVPDGGWSNPTVASRPYGYHVPKGYDPSKPTPLLVLLHGLGASGALQEAYFRLTPLSDQETFLYAFPDGTIGPLGRYWNATNACCDFFHSGVDDVAYLGAVIDDMSARFNVDQKRIYLVGHSNGGFLAHRLACDLAPRIAAIVSLAGDNWKDPAKCQPSEPVAVLQVHGTLDPVILYGGGSTVLSTPTDAYPSAHDSVASWAAKDGCGAKTTMGAKLDLDALLPGDDTTVERWSCPTGAAELWSIQGGIHTPALQPSWPSLIYGFLKAHPKG